MGSGSGTCYRPSPEMANLHRQTERIAELEAALRPFAEAYRTMKRTDQAIGARHCAVQDFSRAAELLKTGGATVEDKAGERDAMFYLGLVLSMLCDLHPDDQCKAWGDAMRFYNAANPNAQIEPNEGYSTRLVNYGPLDDFLRDVEKR